MLATTSLSFLSFIYKKSNITTSQQKICVVFIINSYYFVPYVITHVKRVKVPYCACLFDFELKVINECRIRRPKAPLKCQKIKQHLGTIRRTLMSGFEAQCIVICLIITYETLACLHIDQGPSLLLYDDATVMCTYRLAIRRILPLYSLIHYL